MVGILLAVPGERLPPAGRLSWLDTAAHAALFLVHAGLVRRALAPAPRIAHPVAVAVIASGAYAAILETVQLWIPGRAWEWTDLAAGLLGAAVGAVAAGGRRATLAEPS